MSENTKRKQVRVYFDDVATGHLDKITGNLKTLSESAIMSEVLAAALDAIAKADYKITLPLHFELSDGSQIEFGDGTKPPYRLNESTKPSHSKVRK